MLIPLHLLFSHHFADSRVVCIDSDRVLDWRLFTERTSALVQVLQNERYKNRTRWALCIGDSFDFACGLFALFAAGKQVVLPANHKPAALAQLTGLYDSVLDNVERLLGCGGSKGCAELTIDPHAPLSLVTSGSSGVPKVVHKTLAQFDAEVRTLSTLWGAAMQDVTVVASVPHHHIYGLLFRLLWPLAAGQPFDRMICVEPADVKARLAALGRTILVSSPAQLARWPSLIKLDEFVPAPRFIFSSGGPLAVETAITYATVLQVAPIEVYGSTETGGIGWRCQHPLCSENGAGDAWTPMPGVDVRCTADGALQLRSPHLSDDQWLGVQDAVQIGTDGRFRLLGRLDRIIKLEEKRVSLSELEQVLVRHPWVKQAALAQLNGARLRLGAVIVLTSEGSHAWRDAASRQLMIKALRRYLAEYFDAVVLPRYWRIRTQLPFDERGKLSASALTACFKTNPLQPDVLAEWSEADSVLLELFVPATLVHFEGHFPSVPILPGVVQIDWAARYAARYFAIDSQFQGLDQIKFFSMVRPNTMLRLALTFDAPRARVEFRYYAGKQVYASGRIVYGQDISVQ